MFVMVWLDVLFNGEKVFGMFVIKGWVFKDGVGLVWVEVLVDGCLIGDVCYGCVFDVCFVWLGSIDL